MSIHEVRLSDNMIHRVARILGSTVELTEDAQHADWKTAAVRGIEGAKKGDRATIQNMFQNMYGVWATIRLSENHIIDVPPHVLRIVTPEEIRQEEMRAEISETSFKFQACRYKENKGDIAWRDGIARIQSFGESSVVWIVDAENGSRFPTVWDYRLTDGACKHITTEGI